jgi:hypothetical protein
MFYSMYMYHTVPTRISNGSRLIDGTTCVQPAPFHTWQMGVDKIDFV